MNIFEKAPELTPYIISSPSAQSVLQCIIIFMAIFLCSFFVAIYARKKFGGKKNFPYLFLIIPTILVSALLIIFFGPAAITLKGCVISLILAFCSFSDIKTRECPDYPYIMIVIAALIGTDSSSILKMIFGALIVFCINIACIFLTKSVFNGADIKMSVALGFVLGPIGGLSVLFFGYILAIIFNLKKGKNGSFPLLPFLSIGFYITAIFNII